MSDSNSFHLVVAGGGTGGHLYPGIAVVESLEKMMPNLKVSFVGTNHGIEARVIPDLGYDFHAIKVKPLKSGGVTGLIKGLSYLPLSGYAANSLLSKLDPDFVLAVGGYAAGPFTALAALRHFKTAFMEQNANLGLTNKLLSRLVDRAFLSFESTSKQLPEKLHYTVPGNPIRHALVERSTGFEYHPPTPDGPFHLLIVGGSGGAHSLNVGIPKLINLLPEDIQHRLVVTHQSGRNRLEETEKAYENVNCQYKVVPYIEDMAAAYSDCNLLVCRAGMSTIAEITVLGLPCVFVPFPSKDNHQTANAKQLLEAGAGFLVPDADLPRETTRDMLVELIADPKKLGEIAANSKNFGRPNAADEIAKEIMASN